MLKTRSKLFRGKIKRVHQKGKECCAENSPDELKVNCPKCPKLFRGIDLKAHLKSWHHNNSSVIKCFKWQCEGENLAEFNMHAKQHISNDNMVKHETCNVCSKVVRNKAELKMHTESVYNKECELCLNSGGL